MQAYLGGWLYVPYRAIGDRAAITSLKDMLTYVPKFSDDGAPVHLFRDDQEREYIGVPRAFGLRRYPWLEVVDTTSRGDQIEVPQLPNTNHPRVQDPAAQAAFMTDLEQELLCNRTFIGRAPTGSGKTVCALWLIGRVGVRTIVLVHLERLMAQWIEEIQDKLGLPRERIGIAQGSTGEWQDKDIVIGMLPSISERPLRYGREFYRAFGLAIFDEVHKIGAPLFAQSVWQFPAYYRLGLSATPKRKDGGTRVFVWHLGGITVQSSSTALPMKVYVKRFTSPNKPWGDNINARKLCLSRDLARNLVIVNLIRRMWMRERQALIVSCSVDHIENLMRLCEAAGIDRNHMGQFTGQRTIIKENGEKGRRPIPKLDLSRVKEHSQIIFATYGMIKEGIDIPRLDAGLDATPIGDAEQLIGRIRRPLPGKKEPIWVTLYDERCKFSQRLYKGRLKDYMGSGVTVIDNGGSQNAQAA